MTYIMYVRTNATMALSMNIEIIANIKMDNGANSIDSLRAKNSRNFITLLNWLTSFIMIS